MGNGTTIILATLVGYKILLIAIGLWAARRSGSEADFLIGGRALGPWVAGLSYAATSSSAWVLLGFSGYVYLTGLGALWMLPGVWGGYLFSWVVLGRRLREESARRRFITPGDFLAGDAEGGMRRSITLLVSVLVLFCFLFYVAAQFQAAGSVMQSVLPVHDWQAVALGAAVGLVAVVASASNAPIAAILMGVELFGADATLYVAGACVAAYLIIGHRSVYPEQQVAFSKSSWIFARAGLPVGQEKVRLSYGLVRWWRKRRRRARPTQR